MQLYPRRQNSSRYTLSDLSRTQNELTLLHISREILCEVLWRVCQLLSVKIQTFLKLIIYLVLREKQLYTKNATHVSHPTPKTMNILAKALMSIFMFTIKHYTLHLFFFLCAVNDPWPLSLSPLDVEHNDSSESLELEVEPLELSDATPVPAFRSTVSATAAKAGSFSYKKPYKFRTVHVQRSLHTFLYSETSRNDYFHDSHKF